jgi:tetratricopeptide (TPR) repeat protein
MLRLGDPQGALATFQQALELMEDPASGMTATIVEASLPHALIYVGRALGLGGRVAEGIATLRRALDLFERGQRRIEQARALGVLAELYGEDNPAAARESLLRAADLYESAGLPEQASEVRANAAEHLPAGGSPDI